MIKLLFLGWRNFLRNLERYWILIIATVVANVLLFSLIGLLLGTIEGLEKKGSRYFSGDISIQGFTGYNKSYISDIETITPSLDAVPGMNYFLRSVHYKSGAKIHHNGKSIRQRRYIGVDWDRESYLFGEKDFQAGEYPEGTDSDALLISTVTARQLNAGVGDRVIVFITTEKGVTNTGRFTIKGIFKEESFFGFAAYMQLDALNSLILEEPGTVNEIAVYLDDRQNTSAVGANIHSKLSQNLNTFPVLHSKDERDKNLSLDWEGRKYAVLTLSAQLSSINDLIFALFIITFAIVVVFLSVIVIGIYNTFVMMMHERRSELGTIRALGMSKTKLVQLVITESALLGVTSCVIGLIISVGALLAISNWLDLSQWSNATLFTVNGQLLWRLPLNWIAGVMGMILMSSVAGAIIPAVNAANANPVESIRGE